VGAAGGSAAGGNEKPSRLLNRQGTLLSLLLLLLPLLLYSLPALFVLLQLQQLFGVTSVLLWLGRWPAVAAGVTGVSKGDTETGWLSAHDSGWLQLLLLLLLLLEGVASALLTFEPCIHERSGNEFL
jgi:hypothetical protein